MTARDEWQARVNGGSVNCGRCGKTIAPKARWDFVSRPDHATVPWHRDCYEANVLSRIVPGARRQSQPW